MVRAASPETLVPMSSSAPSGTVTAVDWRVEGGHHRLVVRGDFDARVSAPIGALLEAIALTEPASVTLVADRLTLFGSWGLRALERGAIALAVVGVRLEVSGASPTMRRVLEMFDGPAPALTDHPIATGERSIDERDPQV